MRSTDRFVTRLLAITLALLALATAGTTAARPDDDLDASGVLQLVQTFYEQTKTLQADFKQTRYTRLYDRYDRAEGKVVFKKPGKMRWDYASPNGQVFVTQGDKLLIYQPPEAGERHGQLIERGLDEDQLPAAFSFLTERGNLEKDFDARLLEHDNQTFQDGYVLQLVPRTPTSSYEQLVFYVRALRSNGKQAGVVQRVLILDAAGNRNRFDFSKFKFNREIPDKRFNFRPPRGTHKVNP